MRYVGRACRKRSISGRHANSGPFGRNPVSRVSFMGIRSLASHFAALLLALASFVLAFFLLVDLCFMVFYFGSGGAEHPDGGGRLGESSSMMRFSPVRWLS